MLALAFRTLRARASGFTASVVATFLGATILMAFASLLDTRAGGGLDSTSRNTLLIVAVVVGGWGLLIVAFGIASTLTLSARQRVHEIALLKSIGATPEQVGRLVVGEAALVAVTAALAAVVPAILTGRLLLELLQGTGQVAETATYHFGAIAVAMGLGITFLAATIAAVVAARRAAGMRPAESLLAASIDDPPLSKARIVVAGVFFFAALNTAITTVVIFHGDGIDAMQTAGQGSICAAIGFALLAPLLVSRIATRLIARMERTGASGHLAALNMRQRTQQMANALMPIILFTGIALGTLYMQSIENAAPAGTSGETVAGAKNVETLNFVIVGMIAVFAAIMLVNTLVAATAHRRREFAQLRLAGATPAQVRRMVTLESVVLLATGVVFGSVAALFTVVPYNIARTDSVLPGGATIYIGVVASAAILTLAAGGGATRRALRAPAVGAVTV
jgi:predicted lysophospholipase L1 biosynthesis ABC-type transport system permease subunit